MLLSQKYIKAFCEIKDAKTNRVLSTGYIDDITDDTIIVTNCLFVAPDKPVIISILSQNQGLKVFNAKTGAMIRNNLIISDFEKITDVERRGSLRVAVNIPVSVLLISNKNIYNAMITDISIKGIALWIDDIDIPVDDSILLQFMLDDKICNCSCDIVRIIGTNKTSLKKYGCGFIRNRMAKPTLDTIQSYLFKKQGEIMNARFFHK